jgi:hypothetical protein
VALGIAFAAAIGAACSEAGPQRDGGGEPLVRDSAGIRIVENPEPRWRADEGWTIDPVPALQIGAVEGEPAYQFTDPTHASRFATGEIAVVERRTKEVRIYGRDGRHLVTVGRAGEGPGEFQRSPILAVAEPDTIVTWDSTARRVSRFLVDGTLVEEN